MQGARNADTEIVCGIQRGCGYRATQQFARVDTYSVFSLLILGFLVVLTVQLPLNFSAAIIGIFALFHGYAHDAEMPHSISGFAYAIGFMLATAILHIAGIVVATVFTKTDRPQWLRLTGAVIALFGGTLYFVS